MTSSGETPSITVEGNEFKWDIERGLLEISGGASGCCLSCVIAPFSRP